MTLTLCMLMDLPLAAAFGVAGLCCQLLWPLMRTRGSILAVQFGMPLFYGMQYGMLEAWSGVGVACVGATQTLVACAAGRHSCLKRLGYVFIPAVAVVCAATWQGPVTAFALVACALTMIGRMQADTLHMRYLMLAAAPFGMGFDLMVGAMPALCGAITSFLLGLACLRRELNARRPAVTCACPGPGQPRLNLLGRKGVAAIH